MPHSSSGNSRGLATSVGSESMRQPVIPSEERAAQRWDMPVRLSTRQSSSVSPLASNTAPALKTLLIGYGQLSLLRIGFPA